MKRASELNDEELNVLILEDQGWTFKPWGDTKEPFPSGFKEEAIACWVRPGGMPHQAQIRANYTADLNACAEFEKTLIGEARDNYTNCLAIKSINEGDKHVLYSTARQRCEAYCLTRNLAKP